MTNISKQKRERMLQFLNLIKEEHKDSDEVLSAINEIENEINSKKYGLVWEKHEEQVDVLMQENIPVFNEIHEKEITINEEDYNFLLEGDNLHSLKLLEKTHLGKIDVIYIDPPYNTGNKDFIYNDSFVDKTDGYSHSKWLSFMSERLEIARKLLREEGVIFISIDDNEQSQLKLLCDEIFGENNFIANYKWNKTATAPSLSQKVRNKYEYVLCYEKNRNNLNYNGGYIDGGDIPLLNRGNKLRDILFKKETVKFSFDGILKAGVYDRITLKNDLTIKNGRANTDFIINGEFKWTQDNLNKEVEIGTTFIIKSQKLSVRFIRNELKTKRPSDIISKDECGVDTNEIAKKELQLLVPNNNMDYPKPKSLIKYLLKFNEDNRTNSIILDFFAGSGTTGHAVMQLNKEDGGNRKYILCTNNENNICEEVTYQRLKKIQEELPHNLKYYRTGFVSKDEENLSDELLKHVKEMVQLEHGIKLDNKHYILVLSDDEADELEKNWESLKDIKAIYVSRNVLFTSSQNKKFNEVPVHIIPDYYFGFEMKEVGESW